MKDESSDAYAQAIAFTGLVGLFSLIILLFRGGIQAFPSISQLPLFILIGFMVAIAMISFFEALKTIGASEHTILLTSSRIWLIIGAVYFLKESFTLTKLLGAAAILSGVVLAEWRGKTFVINKGALFALLAAFLFASAETLSYFIVRNFDVLSFMVYGSIFVTSSLIVLRPKKIKKLSFYFKPKNALNIITTSFNDGLANIFGLYAYQIGRNALQIGPLAATQTLVTVILAMIILKEREFIVQRIIGSIAAVLGAILLL